jgi:hypothetical protein
VEDLLHERGFNERRKLPDLGSSLVELNRSFADFQKRTGLKRRKKIGFSHSLRTKPLFLVVGYLDLVRVSIT